MSAVARKRTSSRSSRYVRFVPKPTYAAQQNPRLFDHLVGAQQKRLWNCQPEHLGGLKVDNELKLRRVLHWQVSGLGTAQYAVDISRRLLKLVQQIDAIRDQSASFGIG
jgi:hypothetical protein